MTMSESTPGRRSDDLLARLKNVSSALEGLWHDDGLWHEDVADSLEDARTALHAAITAQLRHESVPAPQHGYGLDSDCLCGRNFDTVRGLREHLTKQRQP